MYKSLIATLNDIDVRGKSNMDKLLGCILVLEQLQKKWDSIKLEDSTETKSGEEVDNG